MIIFPPSHFLHSTSHMTSPTCLLLISCLLFPCFSLINFKNIISTVHLYINVGTPTATLGTSWSPYLLKRKFPPSTFDYSMPIVPWRMGLETICLMYARILAGFPCAGPVQVVISLWSHECDDPSMSEDSIHSSPFVDSYIPFVSSSVFTELW